MAVEPSRSQEAVPASVVVQTLAGLPDWLSFRPERCPACNSPWAFVVLSPELGARNEVWGGIWQVQYSLRYLIPEGKHIRYTLYMYSNTRKSADGTRRRHRWEEVQSNPQCWDAGGRRRLRVSLQCDNVHCTRWQVGTMTIHWDTRSVPEER